MRKDLPHLIKRFLPLSFRLIALIITLSGLIVATFPSGVFTPDVYFYYTNLSNVLVLVFFLLLVIKSAEDLIRNKDKVKTSYYERFAFIVLIDIMLTFLVYWVLLAPKTLATPNGTSKLFSYSNLTVHAIVPILVIIDYFIFIRPKAPSFRYVFLTWVFPLSYTIMSIIIGLSGYTYYTGSHYPYFFLDFETQGALVLIWIIVLLAFFTVLATGVYFLDRKRYQKSLETRINSEK
ncbi:MAG: Pr6Pr family membrane protein [Erysipelotrichaceae bacterium]|nr:Pr6Pr family membrane protein [Erysipelotrichaceae bacterium]